MGCQKGGAVSGGRRSRRIGSGSGRVLSSRLTASPDCAVCFLYAGSSALLLLLANLTNYWFLSFVALVPFLYKSNQSNESTGLRLGLVFGLSFLAIASIDALVVSPLIALLRILFGTVLFAGFGWSLGWVRCRFGLNPVLVAVLWVALEAGLVQVGFTDGLFSEAKLTTPVLNSIGTLFGFLIVALIIVIINSLVIAAVEAAVAIVRAREHISSEGKSNWDLILPPGLVTQRFLPFAMERGPPVAIRHFSAGLRHLCVRPSKSCGCQTFE